MKNFTIKSAQILKDKNTSSEFSGVSFSSSSIIEKDSTDNITEFTSEIADMNKPKAALTYSLHLLVVIIYSKINRVLHVY